MTDGAATRRSWTQAIATVLGGVVGAQIITIGILPILSRIYSPESFGTFSLLLAISAVVAPAAGLRLEIAAMLPSTPNEVRAVVWNSLIAILISSSLATIVASVISATGGALVPANGHFSLYLGLTVALTGTFTLLSQLALREKDYRLVARRSLLQAGVTSVTQFAMSFLSFVSQGLILGHLLGRLAGIGSMAKAVSTHLRWPTRGSLLPALKKYWKFPAIFTPSALMNSLGLQLPLIFVTFWYGIGDGGQVGMAERIVGVPVTMVASAIGQVIDARVSESIRAARSDLFAIYVRLSLSLGFLGLLTAVGLGLLGPFLIPIVLGEEWRFAGTAVQVLAVTSGVRIVATPLSKFLLLMEKAVASATLDILRVLLVSAAVTLVTLRSLDIVEALWLVYSSLTLTYLATWAYGLLATYKSSKQVRHTGIH